MIIINMTVTRTELTVNKEPCVSMERKQIDRDQYNRIIDASPFFRRLGGKEKAIRSYTCDGYKVTKLTSTSPCKTIKVVREFVFSVEDRHVSI